MSMRYWLLIVDYGAEEGGVVVDWAFLTKLGEDPKEIAEDFLSTTNVPSHKEWWLTETDELTYWKALVDPTEAIPQVGYEKPSQSLTEPSKAIPDSLLVDIIFSQSLHNNHLQTELAQATMAQLSELMEMIDNSGRIKSWCELRLIKDNGGWAATLYAVDEWDDGEHPSGHKDKMLLSIHKVEM